MTARSGIKSAVATGVLAAALGISAFTAKYHDYFHDPNLLDKIVYDITGKSEKELHRNRLYELLWQDEPSFKNELERIASSKQFMHQQSDTSSEYLSAFADNNHFLAYLEGDDFFIKASLDRERVVDAAITLWQVKAEKIKAKILLEKTWLQTSQASGTIQHINLENMPTQYLDEIILHRSMSADWLRQIYKKIIYIRQKDGKTVLLEYGETKKMIEHLARKRYMEFLKRYPNKLREEERKKYDEFFLDE